ncbi:MAG TPA: response regulator transcription factor [Anaerolineae bacterium]|nr:response regulator transcription factor [Anaerolineae bacterium]
MSQITILLADDHAVVRAGTRQFLETAADFHVVAEADDGAMARQMLAKHQPHIAILDIRMPHANGIEVTRWIRANYPDTRVLVLTAYDDTPYIKAVLEAGANGYLLKTAPPLTLIQAVRDIHAGKSFVGPAIAEKLMQAVSQRKPFAIDYEQLTERELEVLRHAAKGETNKAIALHLGISSRTAQGHLANIYSKLRVNSRTEAVMKAVQLGWLAP